MKRTLLSLKPSSGVVLPIFSLPSRYGIGDFGSALWFVDFLFEAEQRIWQVLPIFQVGELWNPYLPISSRAGNTLFVSPDLMVRDGFLRNPPEPIGEGRIEYPLVSSLKEGVLRKAYLSFSQTPEYRDFCENNVWLENYAVFMVMRKVLGGDWRRWPTTAHEIEEIKSRWHHELEFEKFCQFVFFKQWKEVLDHAHSRGIQIWGDIPIYFPYESAEVWLHRELFKLDERGNPTSLSGVPGDPSCGGQAWGTPVYDWEYHRKTNFEWWMERIEYALKLFDWVRLDHFRAFVRAWEFPAGKSLMDGRWSQSGFIDFLLELERRFEYPRVFVEDLGTLIPEEMGVIDACGLPTIRVLVIALGSGSYAFDRHSPQNYTENCIAYTSTHDSPSIRAWFRTASQEKKQRFFEYLGREVKEGEVHLECIKMIFSSKARVALIPVQDLLGLGEEARINTPGTKRGNWCWRLLPGQLSTEEASLLRKLSSEFGRN